VRTRRCLLQVGGTLVNTGHDVRLSLDETTIHHVNISGGPLSYHYRVAEVVLHFGSTDTIGSEHTIDQLQFPVEVRYARDTTADNFVVKSQIRKYSEMRGATFCLQIRNNFCLFVRRLID